MRIKRTITILLLSLILMCGLLCSCGKSDAVKNVELLIDEIGEVTVDSEEDIHKAEEAYNALSEEEKKQVENADNLKSKRKELHECLVKAEEEEQQKQREEKEKNLKPFIGTWRPIYATTLSLLSDEIFSSDVYTGNLTIEKVEDTVTPIDETTIRIDRAGLGTMKLVEDQGIMKLVSSKAVFVRKEEYEEAMDKMFVEVTLDDQNISDYIGGPVKVGTFFDEWGAETDTDAYILSSPAYDKGLIMLAFKDVKYEILYKGYSDSITYYEPYPMLSGFGDPTLDGFGRAEGKIWFVRKEYVSDISDGIVKGRSRRITFTDGFIAEYYSPIWNHNVDFSVTDLEY